MKRPTEDLHDNLRRDEMNRNTFPGRRATVRLGAALAALVVLAAVPALATDFGSGDFSGSWDNTLSLGTSYRLDDPDLRITEVAFVGRDALAARHAALAFAAAHAVFLGRGLVGAFAVVHVQRLADAVAPLYIYKRSSRTQLSWPCKPRKSRI